MQTEPVQVTTLPPFSNGTKVPDVLGALPDHGHVLPGLLRSDWRRALSSGRLREVPNQFFPHVLQRRECVVCDAPVDCFY